ncbi:S-adenosyl-L-methionine-dependent methyltransferase [Rhodotorula sp. JG-1b]|nr:S-adenosyl-L-methionine-dependent methyltransferase [Rhodotorula sp. JG-1b]
MQAEGSSSGSESDRDETWDDFAADGDDEPQPATSLFDGQQFSSAQEALQHDKQVHGVDLPLLAATLDFFERIRLINWIRQTHPVPSTLRRLDRNAAFLQDDAFLKPVIEDDALLQLDFDTLSLSSARNASSSEGAPAAAAPPVPSTSSAAATPDPSANDLIEALTAQLSDAQAANDQLRKIVRERCGKEMGLEALLGAGAAAEEAAPMSEGGKGKAKAQAEDDGEAIHKDDDHYYESYQYNDIHEIMLKDRVRTLAYRSFILHPANKPRFEGKVVLDVGCGTGILSMFAAKAGARRVYAVDASNVAYKAMRNIKANGLDETITVIKGKVEEINLPEKVDVIISEWMGYCLLYECMLDSVLYARDKYLQPDGLMVPSQTSILLSGYAGQPWYDDRVKFWDDVYGFDMQAMKDKIEDEAIIEVVDDGEVVSNEVSIADIYTQTATIASLSFSSPFSFTITRAPASSPNATTFTLHALLAHFDTYFTSAPRVADSSLREQSVKSDEGEVFFTTGAWDTPTHWKQTMLVLAQPLEVAIGDVVQGNITVVKDPENSRELNVSAVWTVCDSTGSKKADRVQAWKVR